MQHDLVLLISTLLLSAPAPRSVDGTTGNDLGVTIYLRNVSSIVLPVLPNCIERAAAAELQREIGLLVAGSLESAPPVLYEPQPITCPTPRIFVGNTTARAARAPLPPLPPLPLPSQQQPRPPPPPQPQPQLRDEEAVLVATSAGDIFIFGDDTNAPLAPNASSTYSCAHL